MDIFDTLYLGTPANQALDTPLTPDQKKSMIDAAAQKMSELLDILRIDHRSDPNTQDTPHRVAGDRVRVGGEHQPMVGQRVDHVAQRRGNLLDPAAP